MTIIELMNQIKPFQKFKNLEDMNKEGKYWIDENGCLYYRAYDGDRLMSISLSKQAILSTQWKIIE